METPRIFHVTTKITAYLIFVTFMTAISARVFHNQTSIQALPPEASIPVETPDFDVRPDDIAVDADFYHTLSFVMHNILGGSSPSARAVTGIVTNRAINSLPFAKPNGAVFPINVGVPLDNAKSAFVNDNIIPFLTGLSGNTLNVIQNSGHNFVNRGFGPQISASPIIQKLVFGTITVFDDELTEGHELGSGLVGKAQGFYVACSEDGHSQSMAFTAMFESGGYVDSLSFFGVHRTVVSESHLAIMGGTGKYANAKGYAIVKTFLSTNFQLTDGIETLLEFTVYVA